MTEFRGLFIIGAVALFFDIVLKTPFIIFGLVFSLYTAWLIYNIHELERLFNNIDSKYAPDSGGRFGNIIRNILNLTKQIKTERKRSQRIITRLNEVLRNFPYPTIMLNQNGQILWMDRNAAKLFKLHRKSDVGIKLNNILRNTSLGELLQQPEPAELPIVSPEDVKITLLLSISKLVNDTRIITILDISTRIKLLNIQQEFISNASHELRTPLTVINGYLETLSSDMSLKEHHKAMINDAFNQSQLMSNVIADLLDLSTIENEQIKFSTINIFDVIQKIIDECHTQKGNRILEAEGDTNLTLVTSFYQLYTLIKNLVDNAIKYTKEEGKITIIVESKPTISISVIDDGIGIPEDKLESIMYPFYRINSAGQGSGLGLNIVDKITKSNNAQLTISSSVGKGSTFTVTF